VDGSSNQLGSGARVVLEGPSRLLIEQALRFPFKVSKNQAECEALIIGMLLAKKLGARSFLVKSDSLLVIGQVTGEYQAKEVKRNAGKYTLINGKLFHHGYTHSILTCVSGDQFIRIMEELHEGICGSHIGGRALSLKVVRSRYYWPTMKEDYVKYAQRC